MELTEDMLQRIANTIADLRLRVNLLQQLVTKKRGKLDRERFAEFEQLVAESRRMPQYQQLYDDVLGTLKGGH